QYEAAVARSRAAVSEALAHEAQAEASLLRARLARDRLSRMRERDANLVSAEAYEEAESQARIQEALYEAATHAVDQARAALREAEDALEKTVIRAPIDGVVTRLNVEEGETAIVGTMNNPGSLLLTISDLAVMEAVVQVDETDMPSLELGDSATVSIDAYRDRPFVGTVTEVGHSAIQPPASLAGAGQQPQAVDFEVVITLDDPPAGLRPDLSATADIVTGRRDAALSVPIVALAVRERPATDSIPLESSEARTAAASLRDDGDADQEGVFVVREGAVHFMPVTVGIAGREHFEIAGGVAEGDSVVAGPYETIRTLEDGQAIRILRPAADSARTSPSP
ncbi:MAG: efflux RND transporter periplasmic adaptor subunit, partial [Gemmatimonadota bacterium]